MQELFQVIKQRFEKLELINGDKLNNDFIRDLREQQKARCQKQAWILSMFRAKKIALTSAIKSNYYKYSYEIMRIIDPNFNHEGQPNLSDETFLNDFVCMYTKFFDNYEDKFQFKVKVRNLLRPTNHNILNDMIKYLADFSRDYIQHVYIWHLKIAKKNEQAEENQRRQSMGGAIQSVIYSSVHQASTQADSARQKPLQSFRNSVNIGDSGLRKYNQQNETQILLRKSEFNKIYGILDIQPLPNFVFLDKLKANVDVLRLRMNQLYRDSKYRNNAVKSSVSLYYNSYQAKFNPNTLNGSSLNKQSLIEDSHPHISHPYRVSLVIEKNGFSCINITPHDQKGVLREERNLSPLKEKLRLSSLSNKELGAQSNSKGKSDFVLNSLKVLRVSQNFLPPLANKQMMRVNSQQEASREHKPKTTSFSNTQSLINLQIQAIRNQDQVTHNGVIYYNQELLREAERRKMQKRRISDLRKHFTSEEKGKKFGKKSDPEQKIVEWLDKINMMKQLQRKKILGLS